MWRWFKEKGRKLFEDFLWFWGNLESIEVFLYTLLILTVGLLITIPLTYVGRKVELKSECPTFSISYRCSCVENGRVYHNDRSAVYVPTKCSVEEKERMNNAAE